MCVQDYKHSMITQIYWLHLGALACGSSISLKPCILLVVQEIQAREAAVDANRNLGSLPER